MHVALVSREIAPVVGGGIAPYVTELANVLAEAGDDVTIFTTALVEDALERARAANDPRLPDPRVRVIFVDEPEEQGTFFNTIHRYSANALAALRQHYGAVMPDLVEVPDYNGEGIAIVQAARTLDPAFRGSTVAVRAYTTKELCHVLDGHLWRAPATRTMYSMERYALENADVFAYGGGDVCGTYERYYGSDQVAPGVVLRHPVRDAITPTAPLPPGPHEGEPLKLLYLGRFERRKGVENLVRALMRNATTDWHLTLVGGDTETAPLGMSMRQHLELMRGSDWRIDLRDPVPATEVHDLMGEHHAVVMPSLWECWPNVALEAMRANRPVLASPVGGLREIVGSGPSRAGVLTDDSDPQALLAAVEGLIADPDPLYDLVEREAPRARFRALTDVDEIVSGYHALAATRPRDQRRQPESAPPLVSFVVPYFELPDLVADTVRSALEQTHERVEVIVVNDGSMRDDDFDALDVLAGLRRVRVAHQPNSGLGAARNFGIRLARGRYVVPLDADDILLPAFTERCMALLEEDPSVAYVCCWTTYVDEKLRPLDVPGEGYPPYGNRDDLVHDMNIAGHATAMFRKRLFDAGFVYEQDLTSYEDWMLFRDLHDAGHIGHVVPERLMHYRIRTSSMLRGVAEEKRLRLAGEMEAHRVRRRTAWTP